jgi:O-methyltransferase
MRTPGDFLSAVNNGIHHVITLARSSPFARDYKKVYQRTMCSHARLRSLYDGVLEVTAKSIAGDIVECGTARGGSAALMGLALKGNGHSKRLWIFDTFEGLPAPTTEDPLDAQAHTGGCRGDIAEVRSLMEQLGVSNVELVKGLVQDTLPATQTGRIAFLHIDTDWYDGVRACLETLYDRVSVGGIIQIDDYGYWSGAKKAVEEFFERRQISPRLVRIDYAGRRFSKETE